MADWEFGEALSNPVFQKESEELSRHMKGFSQKELSDILKCSQPLARDAWEKYESMGRGPTSPALFSFEGIQYQYMGSRILEEGQYVYLQNHLRILSALYGVLRPMDGIEPYRLEMETKISVNGTKGLYDYWKDRLWREVYRKEDTVLNLASEEYAKGIRKYVTGKQKFLTCRFLERKGEKLLEKGVHVKMARGRMVRFLAEQKAENPERAKDFSELGFRFWKEEGEEYLFLKEEESQIDG